MGRSLCVTGLFVGPLAPRARLDVPADAALTCDIKPGVVYRAHVPAIPGTWRAIIHSSCVHNEIAALRHRMLKEYELKPLSDYVEAEFDRLAAYCARKYPGVKATPADVVASYHGPLRLRYERARDFLIEGGKPSSRDARISAFVKREKFPPHGKIYKPRLICAREPVFNLSLATYLKPLEEWLWGRWRSEPCWGLSDRTRIVGKGLSPWARANLIRRKWAQFGDPVAFEIDASSFESHVTTDQLHCEHRVYTRCYPGDSQLRWLLSKQRRNRGRTMHGVRFARDAGRASGDFNTGLGNTVVFVTVVVANLKQLQGIVPGLRFDVLGDGDNCVVFTERQHEPQIRALLPALIFESSGHEIDCGGTADFVEQVEFGQSRPVETGSGWVMVRNPRKALSHAFTSHKHYSEPKFGRAVMASVAQCELSLNAGVPVLGPYFEAWHHELGPSGLDPTIFFEWRHRFVAAAQAQPREITEVARLSFERAWGLSPEGQRRLELQLRRVPGYPAVWPPAVEEVPYADLSADLGMPVAEDGEWEIPFDSPTVDYARGHGE